MMPDFYVLQNIKIRFGDDSVVATPNPILSVFKWNDSTFDAYNGSNEFYWEQVEVI